jgi:hypothetical protein
MSDPILFPKKRRLLQGVEDELDGDRGQEKSE